MAAEGLAAPPPLGAPAIEALAADDRCRPPRLGPGLLQFGRKCRQRVHVAEIETGAVAPGLAEELRRQGKPGMRRGPPRRPRREPGGDAPARRGPPAPRSAAH